MGGYSLLVTTKAKYSRVYQNKPFAITKTYAPVAVVQQLPRVREVSAPILEHRCKGIYPTTCKGRFREYLRHRDCTISLVGDRATDVVESNPMYQGRRWIICQGPKPSLPLPVGRCRPEGHHSRTVRIPADRLRLCHRNIRVRLSTQILIMGLRTDTNPPLSPAMEARRKGHLTRFQTRATQTLGYLPSTQVALRQAPRGHLIRAHRIRGNRELHIRGWSILAATALRIINCLQATLVLLLASHHQAQVDLTSQIPKMTRAMEGGILVDMDTVDMVMAPINQNTKQ